MKHGACLGVGVALMATHNEALYDDLKQVQISYFAIFVLLLKFKHDFVKKTHTIDFVF